LTHSHEVRPFKPSGSLRLCIGAVVVAAAASLAACEVNLNSEGLTARETKTFKLNGQPEVTLETFDGSIEVHSWDRSEVEVEVEKRAMEQALLDEIKVAAEQQGNRIVLRVTGPSRSEFRGVQVGFHISPTARLRVAVPRASTLQVKTDDGSISVEDVSGRIVLRTSDGNVTASRVSGEVEVRTDDGAIRMQDASGKLDLDTRDGSIVLDARPSVLRAKTGDGSIRVQLAAETAMTDNWDLTTSDGSVTLTLPSSFDAELDAETNDGSVRGSHPALKDSEPVGEERRSRRSLRTKMGEGGRLLRIRTGDGTIRIES
jgi:DUF4097 and DUF4098 domain-containing protein YvlB